MHWLLLYLIDCLAVCLMSTLVSLLTCLFDTFCMVTVMTKPVWLLNGHPVLCNDQSNQTMPEHLSLHFRFLISNSVCLSACLSIAKLTATYSSFANWIGGIRVLCGCRSMDTAESDSTLSSKPRVHNKEGGRVSYSL